MKYIHPCAILVSLGITSCSQQNLPGATRVNKEVVKHVQMSISELTQMTFPSPRSVSQQSRQQISALTNKHLKVLQTEKAIPLPTTLTLQELGPLCGTTSGDLSDADGDAVAANATITWSCEYKSVSGRVRLSGNSFERDDTPTESFGAFAYGKQNFKIEYLGSQQQTVADASVAVTKNSSAYALLAREDIASTDLNLGGSSFDISASYVPSDTTDPMYSGDMILTGGGSLVYQQNQSDFQLNGDVTVTRDCSSGIFDGRISTTSSHVNTLTVYKECDAVW